MAIDGSNAARELASDLDPAVAYDVEIVIDAPAFGTERWHGGLPAAFVRIDGLVIDAGGALEPAPHPAGSPTLLFGDSIGEGAYDLGIGVTSARSAFPAVLELALDSPVGAVCFAGQGLCYRESPDHVPPLFDLDPAACTWPWYRAGSSRLRAGCFDPAPARIIICIGTNDGFNAHVPGDVSGSVVGFLGALRIAAPEAFLHVVIPFGGFSRDALQAGFTAYRGASGDRRATLIDLGPTVAVGLDRDRETKMRLMRAGDTAAERTNRAYDGLHPDRETHAELGARLAAAIRRAED